MGLFRANNSVANFWMQFATISAYVVVASEVDMGWTERLLRTSFANSFFLESAIAASWLFYHQKPASASLISQESRYLQRRFLRLQNHLHLRIHPVLQDVDLSTESKVEPLTCRLPFRFIVDDYQDSPLFVYRIALLDLACFPECRSFSLPEIPLYFAWKSFQA